MVGNQNEILFLPKIEAMLIADVVPKETILNAIREMPETRLSMDALFDRIIYLYKIEAGLAQSLRGEGNSIENVRENMKSWRPVREKRVVPVIPGAFKPIDKPADFAGGWEDTDLTSAAFFYGKAKASSEVDIF